MFTVHGQESKNNQEEQEHQKLSLVVSAGVHNTANSAALATADAHTAILARLAFAGASATAGNTCRAATTVAVVTETFLFDTRKIVRATGLTIPFPVRIRINLISQ